MTEAQEQILSQVTLLLGEHFDGFALVTTWKMDNDQRSDTRLSYDGGFYQALGLFAQAQYDMVSRRRNESDLQ